MPGPNQGSIRLFRFAGIDVFLHWSWFLVAAFEIQSRKGIYSSVAWNVLEYLALFVIVTIHEFGHAMACRQVGGRADRIVLWPLGGVAYVDPPPRPGATLWSIAAGPLVNVALLPILAMAVAASHSAGLMATSPDLYRLLLAIRFINKGLLIFNILPIYPLDGGQILRSLFWFIMGRARSLMVAAIIGLIGVAGFIVLAYWKQDAWLGAIALFMLMSCWGGLKQAQALLKLSKLQRRHGFSCPTCKTAPPIGEFWRCGKCGQAFDTFQTHATCPRCASQYPVTKCFDCGASHSLDEWTVAALVPFNV